MLVSYDGTAPARRALARAAELAGPGDMVHVIDVMPYPSADTATEQRARQATLLEQAQRTLAAAGLQVRSVAAEGDTATEVLAAAETIRADVVVVALDRERFPHVPGSITGEIVRRANCDVYVVYAHRETRPSGRAP